MEHVDLQACIAGALFDFVGYVSVHPDMPSDLPLGELLMTFADKRKLSLAAANVTSWDTQCCISHTP